MDLQEAVNAGKIHHQWLPDVLYIEEGRVDSSVVTSLLEIGHEIRFWDSIGHMNGIKVDSLGIEAAADTLRGESSAIGR